MTAQRFVDFQNDLHYVIEWFDVTYGRNDRVWSTVNELLFDVVCGHWYNSRWYDQVNFCM